MGRKRTNLVFVKRCRHKRGMILVAFVFASKSFKRASCCLYFGAYVLAEKSTSSRSPVTHSSRQHSTLQKSAQMIRSISQTHHGQNKSNCSHRNPTTGRNKFGEENSVICLVPKPSLVDNSLDNRVSVKSSTLIRILVRGMNHDDDKQ
jgi:hypothetical protein